MMSAVLIGSIDVTGSHSQTWSVLVSIGRMLIEEFLQHFLSVVSSSKYWLQQGKKEKKILCLGIQKFTGQRHPVRQDFSAAPSLNTHDLSKFLLYIPASWVLYLQKGKTEMIFALLVCHVSLVVIVPPLAPRRKRDSLSERDFID